MKNRDAKNIGAKMEQAGKVYLIGNPVERDYKKKVKYLKEELRNAGFRLAITLLGQETEIYTNQDLMDWEHPRAGFIEGGYLHTYNCQSLDEIVSKIDLSQIPTKKERTYF